MDITSIMRRAYLMLMWFCGCASASGQATLQPIDVKAVAEVEARVLQEGREATVLVPAERVVPGDSVIYTLEIRNHGVADIVAPTVIRPVPAHMVYVADSATGPGAEVKYSVDGGVDFERPENLRVRGADGQMRRAIASDYTHIQWDLRITLKAKSVAYARFRTVVK